MNTLNSNLPITSANDPTQYRREAQAHYWKGLGALALTGLGVAGVARYAPFLRTMPEKVAGTMMREPTMLGYGFWEARNPLAYAKFMGLGTHATGAPKWRWIDMMAEVTKRFEEASPSRMLRTFGVYEHLMAAGSRRGATVSFTGDVALEQLRWLRRLGARLPGGKYLEEAEVARRGLVLSEGTLFLEAGAGSPRQEILKHAHLMMRKYVPTGAAGMVEEAAHFGRLAATYEQVVGGEERLLRPIRTGLYETGGMAAEDVSSFLIGGGQTKWEAIKKYGSATTRMWSQRFFRLMDDPFLGMMEILGHYDQEAVQVSRFEKLRSKLGGYRFGLGGKYTGTTGQMFGRWLMPERMAAHPITGKPFWRPGLLGMAIGVPLVYHTISEMMAQYGKGTIAEGGIPGLAAEVSERAMKARATVGKLSGLQRYVRWQEEAAPDTTRMTTMLGLPLAGGLTGAFAGYMSRFGASITGDPVQALAKAWQKRPVPAIARKMPIIGRMFKGRQFGRTGRWGAVGLALGFAAELPLIPGAIARLLGGAETPEELEEVYAGRKEVPVRRSRWWIFGRRAFGGERPEYFTKHWTVRARTRARQRALFEEEYEKAGPIFRAMKQTPLLQDIVDPYYFEKLHYRDRPYPITGPSYLGLGPLDPLYKATIGKVLKPVRYMHQEEWAPEGEPVRYEPRPPLAPVAELGGEAPYAPREPYTTTELARESAEYYSEAIGIIGWIGRLASRATFGDVTPYDVQPRMQSAQEIASVKRAYWDLSLGDPFGTTEAYRRLNPRKNRGQYWNPLRNQMPSWMPGEEYFVNFQIGDPYAKIPRGEYRLPGGGYEALNPELRGLDSEDYPEYNRFKILADVAPYSKEYGYYSRRMTQLDNQGDLAEAEIEAVRNTRAQVKEMKTRKRFHEYKTKEEMRELDPIQRAMTNLWETAAHLGETPVEQIIFPPIAPMGKFVHQRTAIEDYERAQVYGTDLSFWQRLWENFLRPGIYSFAHMAGYEGVPPHIKRQRGIEEYFDKLEYVKYSRLQAMAEEDEDKGLAREYKQKKKSTMTGMNPYGNPLFVLRAIAKRERDYWGAFSGETDPEKRKRILELTPEQMQEAYKAQWFKQAIKDIESKTKKNELSGEDEEAAQRVLTFAKADMARQGQPFTPKLAKDFHRVVKAGEAKPHEYADWYRMEETKEFFTKHRLPGPKWIGWDPRADLEDIKMKMVREEGLDFHDFDLWEDRLYAMTRKPYINENATVSLQYDGFSQKPSSVQSRLRELLSGFNSKPFAVLPVADGGHVNTEITDNQEAKLNDLISRAQF